jgi:CBS domain-containing protein
MNAMVRDVMTASVVAVRSDTSFKDMATLLGSSRVSAFPVVDETGKVLGVVSEADMLIKEAGQASHPGLFAGLRRGRDHERAAGVTAGELMTTCPVTIGPDEPVEQAAFLMYDRGIKRLPVVDGTGHLIGIVSRADVLSVYARPDDDIRREVTDQVILGSLLVDPARFTVTVQSGIVTLSGRPETDQVGQQIVDAVSRVQGVVTVRDRLEYAGHRSRLPASS